MTRLRKVQEKCAAVEDRFEHRRVLFIGTESYDGPAITVIQGLDELGFDVHTIEKQNINSWFCDTVIDDPTEYEYDFVLSNLHWGTRWSHYDRFDLDQYKHILVDGDDNPWLCENWNCKYERHREEYQVDPSEEIKKREIMPYRWVEPLGEYDPDIVFTSQKLESDTESIYLPFGIQREYLQWEGTSPVKDRDYDLAYVRGPGKRRRRMQRFISAANLLGKPLPGRAAPLPGSVWNGTARGRAIVPDGIEEHVDRDENIHSYHRWVMYEDYFRMLQNAKMLVMPGTDEWPGWDNKRHYEALACGCVPLWVDPPTDMSAYPMTDLCEFAVCDSYWDLVRKYRYLQRDQHRLERLRNRVHDRALEFFTPEPIARYFLYNVLNEA